MRLFVVLILGGIVGWLVGSLYPAPPALLAWINIGAVEQRLSSLGNQQPATAPAPAATPLASGQSSAPSAQPAPTSAQAGAASTQAVAPSAATAAQPRSGGAVDQQTLNQYRAWIHEARQTHPYSESEERMYALMMCESRGQAALVNRTGPYSGLFQYGAATWSGVWNTYRDQSILDPRAQIFATALAWQRHMQGQWGCYAHPH